MCPSKPQKRDPDIAVCISDAMKIVRMIPATNLNPPTFMIWATNIFNYINNLPGKLCHIVFDVYPGQAGEFSRPSKGRHESVGERRYISNLSQQLPPTKKAWEEYLSNDQNKHELTNLLIDCILNGVFAFSRLANVTNGNKCIFKGTEVEVLEIQDLQSKHKEADSRLAFHAMYVSSLSPDLSICVVSDDTDVFINLLSIVNNMKGTLYFRQGVGNNIQYHNVSSLADYLGEHCCRNLPSFHALTGCDFTYPFYRRAKFQVFTLMINLKKAKKRVVSVYLDTLGTENPDYDKIIDFILRTVYNRPANEKTPKDSRLPMLFSGKGRSRKYRSTKTLPPDGRSLLMKIKRANLVSYSWKNCLNPELLSMDPCDWGWEVRDNLLIPVWSDTEYDLHIKNTLQNYNEDTDSSDISDSESEYDSDEFAASETYSSTGEDDDIGSDNDF